jgi:hypothetical protein
MTQLRRVLVPVTAVWLFECRGSFRRQRCRQLIGAARFTRTSWRPLSPATRAFETPVAYRI